MKPIVTKKYRELLIESSRQRVLEVFFRYPEKEFSLSEIAKIAKVAKPHIGSILEDLKQRGFITITPLSNIWRIKANQHQEIFLKSKIIYNLNFIYQSGAIEYLNEQYENPKAIILFGSFRRGEDISTSDIDIAMEIDEPEEYQTIGLKALAPFEKIIERKIQLHLFNRKKIDLNIFNNMANGIVLLGFLEVRL